MGLDTLEEAVDEYIDSILAQWTQGLLTVAALSEDHIPKFNNNNIFYFNTANIAYGAV